MVDRSALRARRTGPGTAADEIGAPRAFDERVVRIARDRDPLPELAEAVLGVAYSTAAATFAGSVHGVVVHTTIDSPGSSTSGKRTNSEGSVLSW